MMRIFSKFNLQLQTCRNVQNNLLKPKRTKISHRSLAKMEIKKKSDNLAMLIFRNDEINVRWLRMGIGAQAVTFFIFAEHLHRLRKQGIEENPDAFDPEVSERLSLNNFNLTLTKWVPRILIGIIVGVAMLGQYYCKRSVKKLLISKNRRDLFIETFDLFSNKSVIKVPVQIASLGDRGKSLKVNGYRGSFNLNEGRIINDRLFHDAF